MVQIRCKGTTKIVIFNGKTNQRDGKIVKFANYFGFLKKKILSLHAIFVRYET